MTFPNIDPVFLKLGPIQLRWYGLMYLLGFLLSYFVIRREARYRKLTLTDEGVADLIFTLAIGVVLGGRVGYMLFYDFPSFLQNPLKIFAIWQGGMSFHGGLTGVFLAALWFSRSRKIPLLLLGDLAAIATPIGLCLGRIGNFINGELFGRVTTVPWGMVFPAGGALPRHPSQLYEAFLEGLVLFLLVNLVNRRINRTGAAMAMFLAGYGIFRFVVEYFRQPDQQLGLFFGFISMGQILSLPLILLGIGLFLYSVKGGGELVVNEK